MLAHYTMYDATFYYNIIHIESHWSTSIENEGGEGRGGGGYVLMQAQQQKQHRCQA
jgi:hypothetical protein